MSLMKLKSGTDIRGTAIGENTDLTDDAVKKSLPVSLKLSAGKQAEHRMNLLLQSVMTHDFQQKEYAIMLSLYSTTTV